MRWRIGEAPVFADAAVQPFSAGFGGFDRESLQTVGIKISAGGFGCFGSLADAGAGGDHEERDVIARAIALRGRM